MAGVGCITDWAVVANIVMNGVTVIALAYIASQQAIQRANLAELKRDTDSTA